VERANFDQILLNHASGCGADPGEARGKQVPRKCGGVGLEARTVKQQVSVFRTSGFG
jgi:hypothetical protein